MLNLEERKLRSYNEITSITADYWTWITPPDNPTKNGYTFKWWDKEIPTTMPAENMTIKAIWEKVSGWSSGWWGGGWWGWWGGSSSSCKNLPANAVANNSSTPSSNTNYYFNYWFITIFYCWWYRYFKCISYSWNMFINFYYLWLFILII